MILKGGSPESMTFSVPKSDLLD